MEISILTGPSAFEQLASDWRNLLEGSEAEVLASPAWYLSHLAANPVKKVAVVCARDGGRLVGVMPLGRMRTDFRGLFLPIVSQFAIADYQPLLADHLDAPRILPPMLDAAMAHFGNPGVLWWPHIPANDPCLPILRSYLRERGMPLFEETDTAPRLAIEGRSYEELEKSFTSSHRVDTRRQRKRLAERGPVTLWLPETLEQALEVLEEFFVVHDEKWLSQGYPGQFQSPTVRKHYRELLSRLWNGGIHFSTVRCGDTHVSYQFGFQSGGWFQWYRPSYRKEFHNFSPGKIHISLVLEEACRSGMKGVDFLLGDEPYKLTWANQSQQVVSVWAGAGKLSPSYWWFSEGKPYFRKRFAGDLLRAKALIQKAKRKLRPSQN
ncbi:MAG: GNAT family N-acetyltransferase [Bryobacterales bacterium]|nr:GNAT family N-acetyltransferase [Bryobacterales bacterium]